MQLPERFNLIYLAKKNVLPIFVTITMTLDPEGDHNLSFTRDGECGSYSV